MEQPQGVTMSQEEDLRTEQLHNVTMSKDEGLRSDQLHDVTVLKDEGLRLEQLHDVTMSKDEGKELNEFYDVLTCDQGMQTVEPDHEGLADEEVTGHAVSRHSRRQLHAWPSDASTAPTETPSGLKDSSGLEPSLIVCTSSQHATMKGRTSNNDGQLDAKVWASMSPVHKSLLPVEQAVGEDSAITEVIKPGVCSDASDSDGRSESATAQQDSVDTSSRVDPAVAGDGWLTWSDYARVLAHTSFTDALEELDVDSTRIFMEVRQRYTGRNVVAVSELMELLRMAVAPSIASRAARTLATLQEEIASLQRAASE